MLVKNATTIKLSKSRKTTLDSIHGGGVGVCLFCLRRSRCTISWFVYTKHVEIIIIAECRADSWPWSIVFWVIHFVVSDDDRPLQDD